MRLLYRDRLELQLRATHLAQAAATDPLTGIANRAGLATRASQVLGHGGSHALMLLDLNRFKPINDVHGHEAGDLLLRTVAERLHEQLRDTDTVARLGGDEFAVLLGGADTSEDELTAMARRLGAAVTRPVMFEGKVLQVGTAIGIARGPQDGHHLQALLRAADKAMYRAKTQGAGHAFYERGLDEGTTPSSSATLGDRQVTAAGSG